nr:reverse transcriptase domain-containing protein [Tanacetum cinerariifolium]
MRTRSNFYPFNSTATIPRRSNIRRIPYIVEPEIHNIEEIVSMADRTMKELLQAPTEGYGEAIVISEILAENFEIKMNLLHDDRIDKFADQISNLVEILNKQVIAPAKAVEKTCVTCGGAHAYYVCIATDSNQPSVCAATCSTTSGLAYEGPSILTNSPLEKVDEQNSEEILDKEHSNSSGSTVQVQPSVVPILILEPDVSRTQSKPTIPYPSRLNDQKLREKATNQMKKIFQIFHDLHFDISFADTLLLMPKFASTIKSLLANKDKLFELAKVPLNENCSAMLLKKLPEKVEDPGKFLIPYDFPGMEVCHALADLGASINLMPFSIWKKLLLPELTPIRMTLELADRSITRPKGVTEYVFVKVGKFHFPTDFVVVDFEADPRVPLILWRSFLRTGRALIDVYGEEITLRYNPKSSSPTLVFDSSNSENDVSKVPIVKSSSPTLTPFGESDFFLEEIEDFLNDDSIPTGIENYVYDLEGDILFLEKLLNEDPFQLPPMDFKLAEEFKAKSFVEEPPELELKKLPSHLEYAFLEDSNKLPVIIAKNLKDVEREALINVSKSHKRAIAWKISDIKGIDPIFYTHKILMEDDYKTAVQSQRMVNPKIHDVIKKEVIKLLDAGMIYPISDSPWVSPVHCVPKKGVANENNELIPTRLVTGWRVCIDYRKLNDATRKDHFPLPFMDRMLEREGIVLGHKISKYGIEVDRVKVDGFSKIARPMTHLLEKETPFVFSKECIDAFNTLKKKLTEAPILVVPDWKLPFELMCDASDFAIGTVLGQRKTKHFQPIHYASKTMTEAQIHYTTNEKEMLAVVYAFEKFRPYLVLSKSIVYTDYSALKYFLNKQDAKPRLLRWVIRLQEFDITILDKKGFENLAADHLSRLENPQKDVLENKDINENFPLETLGSLTSYSTPWWVEAKALPTNDARVVVKFLKSLFSQFGILGAIISDRGTHFCNDQFTRVMIKYGVTHRLATAYHPQTSGQVESGLCTAYKTPIGCTPYKLVYGKSCHLPIDLEHRAYWALKHVNFDLKTAGEHRKLQLNELSELRDQAYENSVIYKERTKKLHDSKIKNRIFNVGDQVLLFNYRLKIFSGKLKTRRSGLFTITQVFPYGTIELSQPNGPNFKVNGHRVKHYFGGDILSNVAPDLHTFPMDN